MKKNIQCIVLLMLGTVGLSHAVTDPRSVLLAAQSEVRRGQALNTLSCSQADPQAVAAQIQSQLNLQSALQSTLQAASNDQKNKSLQSSTQQSTAVILSTLAKAKKLRDQQRAVEKVYRQAEREVELAHLSF